MPASSSGSRPLAVAAILIIIAFGLFSFRLDGQIWQSSGRLHFESLQRGSLFTGWRKTSIGSEEWLSRYPALERGPKPRPSWLARYEAVKAQGKLASVPRARLNGRGLAEYPEQLVLDKSVCSYRRSSCFAEDDIVNAPGGKWAINFDDGPLPPSRTLHRFLDEHHEHATHFWIGHNVKEHVEIAIEAAEREDELAIHTWSHPHLTTLTDEEILGELGWTMQIIFDISGKVPKYLRPPFGDTDARIRSIAKHVFGLTTVIWNDDSDDWALNQEYAIGDFIDAPYPDAALQRSVDRLTNRMNGTQEFGVIVLEHELSEQSVAAFMESYPVLAERGWQTGPLAELLEVPAYQ